MGIYIVCLKLYAVNDIIVCNTKNNEVHDDER